MILELHSPLLLLPRLRTATLEAGGGVEAGADVGADHSNHKAPAGEAKAWQDGVEVAHKWL